MTDGSSPTPPSAPSKSSEALRLRSLGLSNKQVAAVLDVPVASARRLVSEGKKSKPSGGNPSPAREGGDGPPVFLAVNAGSSCPRHDWKHVCPDCLPARAESPLISFVRHPGKPVAQTSDRKPTHLIIPDTQCKPDVPLDHLLWAGKYIAERKPDVVVHLGDHWDLPSLSSYETKGARYFEGKRLRADIEAGNRGLELLMEGMGGFRPARMVLLRGNHEDRLTRAINESPTLLDGLVGFGDFSDARLGWEVVDYLVPIEIDGVTYSHFFPQPLSGRPYGGNIETMIKNIGFTFTCGHTQGLWWGRRELGNGAVRIGLVAGSFYQHDEDYKTVQGNHHWRGLIVKHEVADGAYDPMMVSMQYLQRRFGS
jgi:hypothetical protein